MSEWPFFRPIAYHAASSAYPLAEKFPNAATVLVAALTRGKGGLLPLSEFPSSRIALWALRLHRGRSPRQPFGSGSGPATDLPVSALITTGPTKRAPAGEEG